MKKRYLCLSLLASAGLFAAPVDFSSFSSPSDFNAHAVPETPYQKNVWRMENAGIAFPAEWSRDETVFQLDGTVYKAGRPAVFSSENGQAFSACYQLGGWNISNPSGWFMVRFFAPGGKSEPFELGLYSVENSVTSGLFFNSLPWSGEHVLAARPGSNPQFSGKLDLLRGWHTVCWYIARGEEGENLMFLDGRQIFTGKGLFPAGVCGLRIGSRWNTRKTPAENGFAVAFFAHSELPFPQ